MSFIKFKNVKYQINNNLILNNINWNILKKSNWVILGPNGSGKTTLLKMIYGLVRPNISGKIFWLNKQRIDLSELRKSIGWVSNFLIKKIPDYETVYETVLSGKFAMFGYWKSFQNNIETSVYKKVNNLMELLKIQKFKNRRFSTLSQGEQQKVLIARCLMANPYMIILDEPCAGLDPKSRESFLNSLNSIIKNKKNISFIFVTHHIEEIIRFFENVILLKQGSIIKKGRTEQILNSYNLSQLYDINCEVKFTGSRYNLEIK